MELGESKSRRRNSNWDPFFFFLLISFLPALFLTILFICLNIKTIFWSDERGRHSGYIGVSLFLWGFMAFISALLYVIYFLLKAIKEKPKQRKLTSKLYFIFLGSQLLAFSLFIMLIKKGWKSECWRGPPLLFGLMTANGFFIHFLFSKPAIKLLRRQYPYYFPKSFSTGRWGHTMGWPISITMIIVNLQLLLSLLFITTSTK